jgi:hypothetical protein
LNEAKAKYPNKILNKRDIERCSFSGEWNDDLKVRGTIHYRDGAKYEGELFNNLRHGKGVTISKNGNVYKGDFKDGKKNGSGIYTSPSGYKYEGSW